MFQSGMGSASATGGVAGSGAASDAGLLVAHAAPIDFGTVLPVIPQTLPDVSLQ